MKATNIDIHGNPRKLKNLVPGNCKFPFKYRRKDVVTCQQKKDGKWCATSTDGEGSMKTWGFCHGKQTKTRKCPPGKKRNPKTGRCIIIRTNNETKKCPPGKKRNPKTGRCIIVRTNNETKKCPPGKKRNPKTGRCIIDRSSQDKTNTGTQKVKNTKPIGSLKIKNTKPTGKRNNVLNEIRNLGKSVKCDLFSDPKSDLQFLGKGVANRVYLSCFNSECKRRVAVRLMSIDNSLIYNKTHPNKLEIGAYTKFNSLLSKNITAHLPYKIKNFQCSINDLTSTPISDAIVKYQTMYSYGEIKSYIDVLITEFCKYGNAKSFLSKTLFSMSDLDLKIFIFQFMSGIVTLQYHIPGFKHNDIHSENILVGTYNLKNQNRGSNKYVKYILFGKEFYIPFREYCVKIYDFDTMSSNTIVNEKLNDDIYKEVGVTREYNPIFDYHLGMNSMFKITDFYSKHSETKNFYNRQIPTRLRGTDNRFLYYARLTNYYQAYNLERTNLIPHDMETPSHVLLNESYFDQFRVKPKDAEIVDVIDSKIPPFEEIRDLKWMFK